MKGSKKLRKARVSAGITQVSIARKLRISQPLLSEIENGHLRPSYELMRRINSIFPNIRLEDWSGKPLRRNKL